MHSPGPREDDAAWLEHLQEEGVALGERRLVRHNLTFTFNEHGMIGALLELRVAGGWSHVTDDEEVTGGGYFHLVGFRMQVIDTDTVSRAR